MAAGLGRMVTLARVLGLPREMSLTAVATLADLERFGARRVTELAVFEGVTQPAMTQLVTRLEREGLVERRDDPADGRAVVVEITGDGRAVLAARREAQAQRLAELLAELSEEDRAALAAALPVLDRLTDQALRPYHTPAGAR